MQLTGCIFYPCEACELSCIVTVFSYQYSFVPYSSFFSGKTSAIVWR